MNDTDLDDDPAQTLADAMDRLLDEDPDMALALYRSAPLELQQDPTVRLVNALAVSAAQGPKRARSLLEALVAEDPEDADARHALARTYELLGSHTRMVAEYLAVRQLDAASDRAAGFVPGPLNDAILTTATQVIEALPGDFRDRLRGVPLVVEARPPEDLVQQGFDPRSLGLFEGPDHHQPFWETSTLLPRIVLYSANLTAGLDLEDPEDRTALEEEIEITVLHEIGHYFGLDEERLEELGLG